MFYLLLFFPVALILVAFQSAILNPLSIAGGHFDILTIFLVLLTLYGSRELALLSAIVMAPIADAVAGVPLGVSVLPMLSVITLAHWGGKTIFGARLGWPVLVIFLGVLLSGLITLIELYLLGWNLPWSDLVLRILLPTTFLNGLAAFAVYLPVVLISERQELHLE